MDNNPHESPLPGYVALPGLSFEEQVGIRKAAFYEDASEPVIAEDYRNAVGYSKDIDSLDP